MPASSQHRKLTANALDLVPELPGPRGRLAEEFCLYPDLALNDPVTLAPYCRLPDGEWFHYLPDISYAELYRYHTVDAQGRCRRARPFRNANHEAAVAGFVCLLDRSASSLRGGNGEEAMKHLGVLLHVLQDACFGIHALEGPGGCDLFFFDRLGIGDFSPAELLARVDCPGIPDLSREPRSLGDSVPEAAMRLYARYARTVRAARRTCVAMLAERWSGTGISPEMALPMYREAVGVCADVLKTALRIAEDRPARGTPTPLAELEPYEFPLGGYGGYRFRSLETDCWHTPDGRRRPLEFPDISFASGLSFGLSVSGQNLSYRLAPDCFGHFVGTLLLSGVDRARAHCRVINDASAVLKFDLDASSPMRRFEVANPAGTFGIETESDAPLGVLILGDAMLLPRP